MIIPATNFFEMDLKSKNLEFKTIIIKIITVIKDVTNSSKFII
jgi:hypothetical protein